MTLCHCSSSSCSACGLPAEGDEKCACVARAPPPKQQQQQQQQQASAGCSKCAEVERRMQDMESSFAKQLAHRDREAGREGANVRRQLAEARTETQREREARAKEASAHSGVLEAAEAKAAARIAELERQLALAHATAVSEAVRGKKQAEDELKAELAEMRARCAAAEAAAHTANESRLAHVAEAEEARGVEKRLRGDLAAAADASITLRTELADLRAELHTSREQLREAEKAQAALDAERRAQRAAAAKKEADALAYEGAVAEARKLQQHLADALERARKAEAERDGLVSERAQLEQSLAHAERVRELFASVTSRTNDVQAAADAVITQVEARKKAEKATKADATAATASDERNVPPSDAPSRGRTPAAAPVQHGSHSARGPLRNATNTPAAKATAASEVPYPLPRPPSTADGLRTRKGLPSGRPGVRSAIGSARG